MKRAQHPIAVVLVTAALIGTTSLFGNDYYLRRIQQLRRRSGVQDLLHGRPDACQRRKVLRPGSHHGVR